MTGLPRETATETGGPTAAQPPNFKYLSVIKSGEPDVP